MISPLFNAILKFLYHKSFAYFFRGHCLQNFTESARRFPFLLKDMSGVGIIGDYSRDYTVVNSV